MMFIYRDEYYLAQREPKPTAIEGRDEADRLAKFEAAHDASEGPHGRGARTAPMSSSPSSATGPTGTVPLFFEAEFTRFGDLDTHHGD